jgi:phosphoribosyl-ATP pyrophosphohydrolase
MTRREETTTMGERKATDFIDEVARFQQRIGYRRPECATTSRSIADRLGKDTRTGIVALLREEYDETMAALDGDDAVALVDGLADIVFVAIGAMWKLGADARRVMDEVCASNLSKGRVTVGRGGAPDASKGDGFVPADFGRADLWDSWTTLPRVLHEAAAIRAAKAADYMSGGVTRGDYNPFGIESYAHNVHEKSCRIISLVRSRAAARHESIRDSAVDLINYASFLVEYIDDEVSDS